MPLSLLILALSAFAIGTTEFVIMGLLPDVAADLGVSIPGAGWLVTGYALGVAVGAPFMAMATAKLPRKAALVTLMGIFIIGNLLCALASDYNVLMFARVVTALCHGAFFGIGSVVAAGLVPANRRASAVALMFTGLTLANVLGVPLGTALGQYAGWRSTFWAVTVIGVIALIGLIRFLPTNRNEEKLDMRAELGALRGAGIWLSLTMTALFSASMFTLFTYIAPLLGEVTGVSPKGVTWTLLLIGLGLALFIARIISRPLKEAATAAEQLAEGNLNAHIGHGSKDETGMVLNAMRNMVGKLSHIIGEVRNAADNLASASEEVSATAQSMSQATSEQAASVEETSASVEQMSASINQNTENAKVTDGMASKAAKEATDGGESVQQTVVAMKKIAQRISIIDDIAYQTNLLALNAAIE
ncbi:MFS transporter, partial [Pseudomonas syringae]|uniref:MFS transporter n=2 Tax=Pseudomonas syringae TaxID=317 RepID=UPI000E323611